MKYHRTRYNADKIRVSVIRDNEVAYRHFLRGDLEVFSLTAPSYGHDKTDDPTYKMGSIDRVWFYNEVPQPTTGLSLNMDLPVLSDRDVRYGLAHSMNFERMISAVLRGDYARKHSYHTGYGKYSNREIRARAFDLEKAESFFAKAGWGERGPDGIRLKDGGRLSLILNYSLPLHTDRLSFLREEAKKAGVELRLNRLDPTAAFKSLIEKKYQIAWGAWAPGLRPQYYGAFHSENAHKAQTNNITNTDDAHMDALIMRYRDSRDSDERAALARATQQRIHEIGAYIPAYDVPYVREAHWRWVKLPAHVGTRLSDTLFDPVGLSLFWIDEEAKRRTEEALEAGRTFAPVTLVHDRFKSERPPQ